MSACPARGKRTGRSANVLQWLSKHRRPHRATVIHKAIDPDSSLSLMYGTLSTLVRRNKLTTTRIDGHIHFVAAPDALTNQRTGKPIQPSSQKPKAPAKAHKSKAKPTALAKATHTALLVTPNSRPTRAINAHGGAYMAAKDRERLALAADLAAFESRGGKIEKLSHGAASRPLAGTYGEYGEALQRKRAAERCARQRRKALTADPGDDSDPEDE